MTIAIKKMSRDELEIVMEWAKDEGWNPGRYDYNTYYTVDPSGFLLLTLDEKPIGSISIVRHNKAFAFIGLFIVLPGWRGQGYGKKLWEHALALLNTYHSIGLYSARSQISRYSSAGFLRNGANHRWVMEKSPNLDVRHLISEDNQQKGTLSLMVKYDASLWGSSRRSMLRSMISQPETYAFVTFNKEGTVNGYGIVRPCAEGYRIGPIYCEDKENAKLLTEILTAQIPPDSKIIFDIPSKNTFSRLFAEYFHLTAVPDSDTEIMFKGNAHEGAADRCYGVASLEIG